MLTDRSAHKFFAFYPIVFFTNFFLPSQYWYKMVTLIVVTYAVLWTWPGFSMVYFEYFTAGSAEKSAVPFVAIWIIICNFMHNSLSAKSIQRRKSIVGNRCKMGNKTCICKWQFITFPGNRVMHPKAGFEVRPLISKNPFNYLSFPLLFDLFDFIYYLK